MHSITKVIFLGQNRAKKFGGLCNT